MAVVPICDARTGGLRGFRGGATAYRLDGRRAAWVVAAGPIPQAMRPGRLGGLRPRVTPALASVRSRIPRVFGWAESAPHEAGRLP